MRHENTKAVIPYRETIINVIAHLNELAGSRYRPDTPNTIRLLTNILEAGYFQHEIGEVINKKIKEWNGTDMEKYIRPSTLFTLKNFENYLNQPDKDKPVLNNKVSYGDKLKDPRWQKKRLEILDRDKWKCRACYSDDRTLHIHHTYYKKDSEPWDYEELYLITLCEQCHKAQHQIDKFLKNTGIDPLILEAIIKINNTIDAISDARAFDVYCKEHENK